MGNENAAAAGLMRPSLTLVAGLSSNKDRKTEVKKDTGNKTGTKRQVPCQPPLLFLGGATSRCSDRCSESSTCGHGICRMVYAKLAGGLLAQLQP